MSDQLQPKTCGIFDGPRSSTIIPVIEARGDSVIAFPQPRYTPTNISASDFKSALDGCRLLVLTDVVAAEEFVARLAEYDVDPALLDELTVCALGEAVADRLRFIQVHADIIPPRTDPAVVIAAIDGYFGDLSRLKIVVAGDSENESPLIEILRDRGADVSALALYRFEAAPSGHARLAALLAGGGIDEFVICEPFDVLALERLAGTTPITELLRETAVLASSEVEFCSLQEAGLRPLYFRR